MDSKNFSKKTIWGITFCCLILLLFFNPKLLFIYSVCFALIITLFVLKSKQKKYFSEENHIYELIHDMKTPAVAELRATELLLNGTFGTLNETQKEILFQINNSSEYLLNIINNISTVCSFEQNNINLLFEKFDIQKVIKMCIDDHKYIAKDKRCTILFDYSEEEIFVQASKTEITRVLYNLLTNAVKYSYPDRVITVITRTDKDKCLLGVNSYGDVIEKENLHSIFQKYKSLNKTGNGLGLYTCSLILAKHGCEMIVKSDKKTGNYFGFELQLAKDLLKNVS